MSETYEFSTEENKQFRGLVLVMRMMSAGIYLAGGLYITLLTLNVHRFDVYVAKGLAFTFALIMGSAIIMTISALLYDSSSKFQKVIDTEGNDIEHLMTGLKQLNKVFRWSTAGMWILSVLTAMAIGYILLAANGGA